MKAVHCCFHVSGLDTSIAAPSSVFNALTALKAQRERESVGDVVGGGGRETFGRLGHRGSIAAGREQIKNPRGLQSQVRIAMYLTADVLRELMPLFAVVRAKRRPSVITCLSALQGLSNFPVIGDSNSVKGYFSLEPLPNRNELNPVHWTPPAALFQAWENASEAREVPPKKHRGHS
jgi:hypothetical protein